MQVGRKQNLTDATWRPGGLTKSVISRVITRVSPFRVLVTLLITHLLSPLGLQARVQGLGTSSSLQVAYHPTAPRLKPASTLDPSTL